MATSMGLPLSTLLNTHFTHFLAEKMKMAMAPMPNAKTIRVIEQARKDFKAGKTAGPFETAEEVIAYLKKH